MEALTLPSLTTSHLSTKFQTTDQTPFPKSISSPFSSSPKPTFSSFPIRLNRSKSKLYSTTSPTLSTDSPPQVEIQEDSDDKFDWFSQWYPVAGVCDLDKRVPHARKIIGLDVVVWWDRNEEKWQVFDDSCPHRLAPLSEGRIDQWGRLQCVYHGWCFNGSGDCKFIPQAPTDGPQVHTSKKACAAVYPCIEQNKILWFWPKTEPQSINTAMKEKPPYFPELDDPSYSSSLMTRDIPYGYEVLIENLMDPAHVPYAHYGVISPTKKPSVKADREGGMPLEINVKKLDKSGFLAEQDNGINKFVAPCVLCYSPNPVSDDAPSTPGSGAKKSERRALGVFFCIPISPGKSRVMFAFPRNFAVWVDRVIPPWIIHIRSNLVLDSDLFLLHLEERKIADVGVSNWQNACFVPTKSDASVVAYRTWLKKYSGGQIPWGPKFGAKRLPIPPKEQLMDRYWSHVVNCSSCSKALNGLKAFEVALQLMAIASIGIIAIRQSVMSMVAKTSMVSLAVLCFAASRWLSHFIHQTFYFQDYNHALR